MMRDAYKWLRELGAIRPMAPASETVLVLGDWSEGFFPVSWKIIPSSMEWNGQHWETIPEREEWKLFGVSCRALTKEDCERVLRCLGAAVQGKIDKALEQKASKQ